MTSITAMKIEEHSHAALEQMPLSSAAKKMDQQQALNSNQQYPFNQMTNKRVVRPQQTPGSPTYETNRCINITGLAAANTAAGGVNAVMFADNINKSSRRYNRPKSGMV